MRRRGLRAAASLLGLLLAGTAARAAVRAHLDTDRIAPGETVQLTLEHDGQTADQPDLGPLRQDFDVLVANRSSSVQIVNGSISSHVRTQLTLSPKHAGEIVVPSISWGGERSAQMTLTVDGGRPAGAAHAAQAGRVFIETVVGQKDPFVQAAVNVTVRVFTTDQLYQPTLELPPNNDALVQQIGGDENHAVERNGVRYDVAERHYVIFPQHSGDLQLPGAVLAAQVPVRIRSNPFGTDAFADAFGIGGGLMSGAKPIRVNGDPIELHVRPRPAQAQGNYWLPARGVALNGEWRPADANARVGDPVTLNLHLQADDLTAAQLPDLASLLTLPPGLKSYPDAPKLNNIGQGDRIVGTRDQDIALIADQPGRYELPAVHIHWWDTKSDQPREASLPARTLTILPAVNAAPATAPAAAPAPASSATAAAAASRAAAGGAAAASGAGAPRAWQREPVWLWISFALALLWAVTVLAWWLSRRRRAASPAAPRGGARAASRVDGTAREADRPRPGAGAASIAAPEPAAGTPVAGATAGASRSRPPPAPVAAASAPGDGRAARSRFFAACERSDAAAARRQLLDWAAAVWPDSPPSGLQGLAAQLANPDLAARLEQLDRACFGGEAWNGAALSAALRELPARPRSAPVGGGKLAPLYP